MVVDRSGVELFEPAKRCAEAPGGGLLAAQEWAGGADHPTVLGRPVWLKCPETEYVEVCHSIFGVKGKKGALLDFVRAAAQFGREDQPPDHVCLSEGGLIAAFGRVPLELTQRSKAVKQQQLRLRVGRDPL
jgi:hypothetical protein